MGKREPSFFDDLLRAASAWVRFPWLPSVSLVLSLGLGLLGDPVWPLGLLVGIIYAGWLGTERVSYMRAYQGQQVDRSELYRLTLAFVSRYTVLGIVAAALFMPVPLATILSSSGPSESRIADLQLWTVASSFAINVCATFVTPALAFTTRRVTEAIKIGMHTLRSEWPHCAWYALLPPLVSATVLAWAYPWPKAGLAAQIAAVVVFPLTNLLFKGATAAFYLRRHESGSSGSALRPRSASDAR